MPLTEVTQLAHVCQPEYFGEHLVMLKVIIQHFRAPLHVLWFVHDSGLARFLELKQLVLDH